MPIIYRFISDNPLVNYKMTVKHMFTVIDKIENVRVSHLCDCYYNLKSAQTLLFSTGVKVNLEL